MLNPNQLPSIIKMIDQFISHNDMLVSTKEFLLKLKSSLMEDEVQEELPIRDPDIGKIIVSCDASIKKNPGGPASVGIVIQRPGVEKIFSTAQLVPAKTSNQAEYDAVYSAIVILSNLVNSATEEVVIRSDSQVVIHQLKGEKKCLDKKLQEKRDIILRHVSLLPMRIVFEWMPRNSTPGLELANHLAQDLLGVPRH